MNGDWHELRARRGHHAAGQSHNWRIEAWRGCAAWMVVYAHFWSFSGSDWPPLRLAHTGVDLFFVISGFVFAPYLFGRPLAWRAHAVRRFFRIYPAYLAALMLYAGIKAASGQPLFYLAEHLAFFHVQHREMAFYYNPPFWSLPAEVEFYLVLPALASAAGAAYQRWGERGPQVLVLALLFGAAALRWALAWASDSHAQNTAFISLYHLPGVLVEFLFGAVAWLVSNRSLSIERRIILALAGITVWCLLAVWFGQVGDAGVEASPARGLMGALTAACFALMVAASTSQDASATFTGPASASALPAYGSVCWMACQVKSGLRSTAIWSGRLSYGVYLFHVAALGLAEHLSPIWGVFGYRSWAVLLTLAMACAVYLAWENPWRLLGRRWAARLGG